jgi:hypothetical protein
MIESDTRQDTYVFTFILGGENSHASISLELFQELISSHNIFAIHLFLRERLEQCVTETVPIPLPNQNSVLVAIF